MSLVCLVILVALVENRRRKSEELTVDFVGAPMHRWPSTVLKFAKAYFITPRELYVRSGLNV
jgi:hypothetical protein